MSDSIDIEMRSWSKILRVLNVTLPIARDDYLFLEGHTDYDYDDDTGAWVDRREHRAAAFRARAERFKAARES